MNANDSLSHHNGTESYYKYLMGYLLTDGVKELATQFQCYWFLDVVVSHQPDLEDEEFQVWTLKKNVDNSADVVCTDGNNKVLKSQHILMTDFTADEATVWVEGNVILLPSEH